MSQPPDHFERIFDFTDFSATQPSAQHPGQKIDQELNAARESLNETIDRLGEIQRDDGKLRASALDTTEFNGIVNAATATATAAATSATASATTATTKAGEATTSATTASNAATTATGASASAQAQATVASSAATTATTKAAEAAASADSALTSKNSAFASASSATSSAGSAAGHAATAATQAGNAANSALQAGAQANLAVAAAVEAENAANSFGLSVGTVTTGAAGSPATVSVTGSAPAYVLNFGIPTGLQGPAGPAASWGTISGTLSSQTDLQGALDSKYSTTNPAGYITSSALTGYATESWVTAGFYPLSGNPSGFLTSSALTPYAPLAGSTFTGKVNTVASTTTTAGLNIPHGVAPTSPVNGDIWTTTGNVFVRLNGGTQALANIGGNNVFTNASSTYGSSTATGTIGLASGATISGSTKTLNIGTGGVSGSTTNIAIGSTTGTSTTTLQGITNGVTQSAGDSSLKLATTAFVTTADNLKADLASPTFTGTPTLPTGTIAVTQSAGNNTTAVATTAFVTAAVPAIATYAESQQLTSTTKVMSPYDVLLAMMTEGYRPALGMTGGSSGTGAGVNPIMPQYMGIGGPNAGVAGSCHAITNNFGSYSTASGSGVTIKWNKPVCLSGTFSANGASVGDANNEFKLFLGPSMLNGNDPNAAAIGLWRNGGTSAISLMVHNGTTLTKVASAGTYSGTNPIRYLIYSDGAGNVTLYINGTQVATTALGPTGSTQSNVGQFTASILQNASAATKYYIDLVHPKIFVAPQ